MKPELTPELKERFFAMYYGQTVAYFNDYLKEPIPGKIDGGLMKSGVEWDDYLLLRPVASITDEEARQVLSLCGYTSNKDTRFAVRNFVSDGFSAVEVGEDRYIEIDLVAYDYLRSIGVALPFMGYTVNELVEAGWIKLVAEEVPQS